MTVQNLSWSSENELSCVNDVLRNRISVLENDLNKERVINKMLKERTTEDFFNSIFESIRKAKIDVTIRPN